VSEAEAWWLSVEEPIRTKPADPQRIAAADDSRVSGWIVGGIWGSFAGLMIAGFLVGGWLVDQIAHATPPSKPKVAAVRGETDPPVVARLAPKVRIVEPAAGEPAEPVATEDPPKGSSAKATLPAPVVPPAEDPPAAPPAPPAGCAGGQCAVNDGKYGTSVDFVADPTDAAKQALKEKKLLFVLNISGNFEDDKFT
jgi:hypothetical protein